MTGTRALFTDWCAAAGHIPLPAGWATVTAFNAGCPGAPATVRRRLAAVTHHHRAAGHPPPTDQAVKEQPALPARELIDPGQAELVLRLLPSHGWTAGLFGRRDRALLTLAAATPIPYRQLAHLTVGQLHIAGGFGLELGEFAEVAHAGARVLGCRQRKPERWWPRTSSSVS